MRDYLELGCAPSGEEPVQVGTENYMTRARAECRRYVKLLEELFPPPGEGDCRFIIKTFPHDFGSYLEVCASFDSEDEEAIHWAFNVENNLPHHWPADDTQDPNYLAMMEREALKEFRHPPFIRSECFDRDYDEQQAWMDEEDKAARYAQDIIAGKYQTNPPIGTQDGWSRLP